MTRIVKGGPSGRETVRLRPLEPAGDHDAIAGLDTAFVSGAVLDVVAAEPLGFALVERAARPPVRKRYALDPAELSAADHALVAERGARVVGVAAMSVRAWNGRAELSHLYVDAGARGTGVGRALLDAMRDHARRLGERCLWVETQNVNAPAIRFYRRHGFACCGLDTSLYDPRQLPGETAVFLALALDP